ncbi:tetratricopeptide repeat protein, partial [Argonema antarcticum]|uniref:tetratricopeptide repeat protein n=1 Tax=Argonema antarcticum TaxID=2942763 RepID=UPI002011CC1E|nr:tetratricopeptide repeat protein [Argonema antarcticum A004/B2]
MGRKEEVEVLQKWLANPNISTIAIQGLGGIGKSSLAAYLYKNSGFAAKSWADVSQKPDFAAFAEKTIPTLGGSVTQTGDTTQLINDLLKCLRQKRCLLVIDNLETLLDEAREFPDSAYQQLFSRWLQQGETSTLLLTTQEQPKLLQAESNWYALAGMTPSDGAKLLQKLEIQGTVEELAAFAAIVDGHPLTLQLVAGFLRQYCDSRLSGVAELGLQQFDLVYRQAEGSHRDKEDARLEWILQQHLQRLSEEQQNFLVNLSVYRLPFDVRAAGRMLTSPPTPLLGGEGSNSEASSGKDEGQVVDNFVIVKALRELYNRSLLLETEDKSYYKFQPLVQEYLQKQGTDLSAAHQKAINYYLLNTKNKPWQSLDDVTEYLEIFYHWCQLKQYSLAFDILNFCNKFLDLRGYNKRRVELYLQLVDFKEPKDDFQQWQFLAALTSLGNAYDSLGQYQEAIGFYQQHLEIAREIGNRSGEGGSLCNIGHIYHSLGQYEKAINYYQEALAILQPINHREFEANSLGGLGNAYDSLGQYEQAIQHHQHALEIYREIDDLGGEASSLGNLGTAYHSLGQYQEAIGFHLQHLEIAREIGDRLGEGTSLGNLGTAYHSLGQYQEAIGFHLQHLEIAREIGDKRGEGGSLGGLGNAYNSLGQYQEAIRFYQQHLEIAREIGDRSGEGGSLGNLGTAYHSLGQYQEAIGFHLQHL